MYQLIELGEVESYLEGGRRRIVVDSYRRYVERQVAKSAGIKLSSSNPKTKARLAALRAAHPDSRTAAAPVHLAESVRKRRPAARS